jgi:hypothetical protein
MRTLKEQLIDVVDAFAAKRELSDSRISTMVFGDGKIIGRLRGTGDLTTRRYEMALVWFSENWPEGAVWPDGVGQPASEDAA